MTSRDFGSSHLGGVEFPEGGSPDVGSRDAGRVAEAPRVAVLIPCYNEAITIEKVVKDFARELPQARVYVFDNNSTDGSGEIARRAGAQVLLSSGQGKGKVIRHMLDAVDADVYVLVDGDDTYPAEAAPEMLARFQRDQLDMLVGTRLERYEEGAFRPFHHFGNHLISRLINVLFQTRLDDVLSGYRMLSQTFVRVVRTRSRGFEVETEMTLQALSKGLSVAEMPVRYLRRREGSTSKLSTWSDGFLIFRCIFLLFRDYKPLVFFTTLALLLAVASLITGSAPIRDYMEMRLVLHIPRAILAAALGTLSLICLTAGLILDMFARFHQETMELWKSHLSDRH
jgi:glycosyltransferase involved in cell wall biosynthesis